MNESLYPLRMDMIEFDADSSSEPSKLRLTMTQTVGKFTQEVRVYVTRHSLFPHIGFISDVQAYRENKQPVSSVNKMMQMAKEQVQNIYRYRAPRHHWIEQISYEPLQILFAISIQSKDLIRVCTQHNSDIFVHPTEQIVLKETWYDRAIENVEGLRSIHRGTEHNVAYDENLKFYRIIGTNIEQIPLDGEYLYNSIEDIPPSYEAEPAETHRIVLNPALWEQYRENALVTVYNLYGRIAKRVGQEVECIIEGQPNNFSVSSLRFVDQMQPKPSVSYFDGNESLLYTQEYQSESFVEASLSEIGWGWGHEKRAIYSKKDISAKIRSSIPKGTHVRFHRGKVTPQEADSNLFQSMYQLTKKTKVFNRLLLADALYRLYQKNRSLDEICSTIVAYKTANTNDFSSVEELILNS